MASVRELERYEARVRFAGMVTPPPAMVKEAVREYNKAMRAKHAAFMLKMQYGEEIENLRKRMRSLTDRRLELLKQRKKTEDEDVIAEINEELEDTDRAADDIDAERSIYSNEVADDIGVDTFWPEDEDVYVFYVNLNLKGWKYNKLLKKATKTRKPMVEKVLRDYYSIRFEIHRERRRPAGRWVDEDGWQQRKIELSDQLPLEREQVIKHELVHMAQSLLTKATGVQIGYPSEKMRDPDIEQHMADDPELWELRKRKLEQRLSKAGFDQSTLHHLDDIEFYTDMLSCLERFRRSWREIRGRRDVTSRKDFFQHMMVDGGDRYMKDLKYHNPRKWKKAIKELWKALFKRG